MQRHARVPPRTGAVTRIQIRFRSIAGDSRETHCKITVAVKHEIHSDVFCFECNSGVTSGETFNGNIEALFEQVSARWLIASDQRKSS